jgi:hypothetical protein
MDNLAEKAGDALRTSTDMGRDRKYEKPFEEVQG